MQICNCAFLYQSVWFLVGLEWYFYSLVALKHRWGGIKNGHSHWMESHDVKGFLEHDQSNVRFLNFYCNLGLIITLLKYPYIGYCALLYVNNGLYVGSNNDIMDLFVSHSCTCTTSEAK